MTSRCRRSEIHKNSSFNMTNAKDRQEKQEELKSCPVAAALAPVNPAAMHASSPRPSPRRVV